MPRPRGNTWQADAGEDENGKRIRRDGFSSLVSAEVWELQARAAIKLGQPLPPGPHGGHRVGVTTMDDLFKHACKTAWPDAIANRDSRRAAERFVTFVGRNKPAAEVNSAIVYEWISRQRERSYAAGYINRNIAAVTRMFSAGCDDIAGLGLTNHLKIRKERGARRRRRVVSFDEEDTIIGYCNTIGHPEFARFTMWLIDTGMRRGEALNILRTDVNPHEFVLDDGNVVIGTTVHVRGTKTATSDRHITITKRCEDILLRNQWDGGERLFNFPPHKMLAWWNNIRAHLNIYDPDFVIHAFRHTSVTRQINLRIDFPRIQKHHGHADIETTMSYAHQSLDAMVDVSQTVSLAEERRRLRAKGPATPLALVSV